MIGLGIGCDYALMVQVLKDTLVATKLSYSQRLFKGINAAIFVPMSISLPIGWFDSNTQIYTLLGNKNIHICRNNQSNRDLIFTIAYIVGIWIILAGFFALGLFLFKLRQVECVTVCC